LQQVTCEYRFDHGACVPIRVHTVVVSVQHSEKVTLEQLREDVMEKVVKEVIPAKYLDGETKYHINPCGNFIIGGPMVSLFSYSLLKVNVLNFLRSLTYLSCLSWW